MSGSVIPPSAFGLQAVSFVANKLGVGTSTPGPAAQIYGGLVISTGTPAATDPGNGNVRIQGNCVIDGSLTVGGSGVGGGGGSAINNNLFANSDFRFNNDSRNNTVVSNNYFNDVWRVTSTGGSVTPNISSTVPSGFPLTRNTCALTLGATANGITFSLSQRIENVRQFSGRTLTLSFWAACNFALAHSASATINYGTGGSPSTAESVSQNASFAALSSTPTKYETTFTIPDLSAKTFGTNGNDYIEVFMTFTSSAGGQLATTRYSQPKLEFGSSSTPFSPLPDPLERAMVERYLQILVCTGRAFADAAGRNSEHSLPFRTVMRTTPNPTVAGGTNANLSGSVPSIFGLSPSGGRFNMVSAAAGDFYSLTSNVTLDARL
jgi:hypothetical protein